jgi:hypothetical protein
MIMEEEDLPPPTTGWLRFVDNQSAVCGQSIYRCGRNRRTVGADHVSFISCNIVIVIIAMIALPLEVDAGWTGRLASSWTNRTVSAISRRRGDPS